jgi:ATP-dependent DNA helicase RecG
MTATPIPRTLALTVYGDLDVSVIREVPPGRHPVRTVAKPESRHDEVYGFLRGQLDAGRQAYVIYPLVEESEKIDLKAATEMHDHLSQEILPAYRVGLLHGRMTVVEVGIDVPNATVMLIEHAERFGLSQLHQLRGRVGRGAHESSCFLMYRSPLSDEARERLKAMTETTDGFQIAERDLRLRGPGDLFGTRQAGMPTFRLIDLIRDHELLEIAEREVARWFETTAPTVEEVAHLRHAWGERFKLIDVG